MSTFTSLSKLLLRLYWKFTIGHLGYESKSIKARIFQNLAYFVGRPSPNIDVYMLGLPSAKTLIIITNGRYFVLEKKRETLIICLCPNWFFT